MFSYFLGLQQILGRIFLKQFLQNKSQTQLMLNEVSNALSEFNVSASV